jgi:hypothetical protein
MTYGFKVTNSSGDIIVDENFRNLLKIGEGSSNASLTTLTFSSQVPAVPQIFVRPWADEYYVGACFFQAGNVSVELRTNRLLRLPDGSIVDNPSIGFDWIAFGTNNPVPFDSSNYGVRVTNSSNQLVFDSRYEVPRVQQVLYVEQPGLNPANMTWPRSYSFSGWGLRPWIGINPFSYAIASEEEDCGFFVTTTGTSTLKIRQGNFIQFGSSTAIRWIDSNANGAIIPFPGNQADIALMRRYGD